MAVTNTSHGFPAVRAENGSSFTSAPSDGFHVDTAAFSDGWPDGRFWTQIGSTFDPNPYGMLCKRKELPQNRGHYQTPSPKTRLVGRKILPSGTKEVPPGRKTFQSGTKDLPLGRKTFQSGTKDRPLG